jgi:hypothetical protein
MDSIHAVLTTLPALGSVRLSSSGQQSTRAHHESLSELLRIPPLRSVCFDCFYFTPALCRATASAFMEGTAINKLDFSDCSFSTLECADIMANGLARNTSVSHIKVVSNASPFDQTLNGALAAALPSNSTLQELSFHTLSSNDDPGAHIDWSPIFNGLGRNTGLKTLLVDVHNSMDESLCTAMKCGLGKNATRLSNPCWSTC